MAYPPTCPKCKSIQIQIEKLSACTGGGYTITGTNITVKNENTNGDPRSIQHF